MKTRIILIGLMMCLPISHALMDDMKMAYYSASKFAYNPEKNVDERDLANCFLELKNTWLHMKEAEEDLDEVNETLLKRAGVKNYKTLAIGQLSACKQGRSSVFGSIKRLEAAIQHHFQMLYKISKQMAGNPMMYQQPSSQMVLYPGASVQPIKTPWQKAYEMAEQEFKRFKTALDTDLALKDRTDVQWKQICDQYIGAAQAGGKWTKGGMLGITIFTTSIEELLAKRAELYERINAYRAKFNDLYTRLIGLNDNTGTGQGGLISKVIDDIGIGRVGGMFGDSYGPAPMQMAAVPTASGGVAYTPSAGAGSSNNQLGVTVGPVTYSRSF